MCDIRVRLEEGDQGRSKFGIFVSELEGESGEDVTEVPTVLEIARTEEGRSESPVCKDAFGGALCDRRLAGPGEPVQPVYRRQVEVFGP